jgi:AcrR family transcriptional regulator
MADKDGRKEKNRGRIRIAALELFEKHGFKKVSVNDIADKAGVSPVTIYNNFGNKDELIRDVIKNLSTELLKNYEGIVRSDKPFLEKLDAVIFNKARVANLFQGELIQSVMKNDPEIYQFVVNIRRNEADKLILELFNEGKEQGYVSPGFSKDSILLYMEILRQGIFAIPDFSERIKNKPNIMREIISLAVYGFNG